ncbi:MAG: AMMECR1 domain-containing protein [Salinarchaeum sp.]
MIAAENGRRGLLSPRVATEHNWDAETFLAGTCRKAGLSRDA